MHGSPLRSSVGRTCADGIGPAGCVVHQCPEQANKVTCDSLLHAADAGVCVCSHAGKRRGAITLACVQDRGGHCPMRPSGSRAGSAVVRSAARCRRAPHLMAISETIPSWEAGMELRPIQEHVPVGIAGGSIKNGAHRAPLFVVPIQCVALTAVPSSGSFVPMGPRTCNCIASIRSRTFRCFAFKPRELIAMCWRVASNGAGP